jgi:ABC-type molybdenum transport system ATPase subunit/photorepair protein PhrA
MSFEPTVRSEPVEDLASPSTGSGRAVNGLLLDVKNLSVSFGDKEVVHGINFSIAPGCDWFKMPKPPAL